MRRIGYLIFVFVFAAGMLTGCGSRSILNEQAGTEQNPAITVAPSEQEASSTVAPADITDTNALLDFMSSEITELPRAAFDKWDIYNFDLTGNGKDEALLVSSFDDSWQESMIIVTGDSGEYKIIPSKIPLGKYNTSISYENGILAVTTKTGGTGEQFEYLDIFVYNGTGMTRVIEGLYIEHIVSFPDTDFVETATIDGPYTAFTYTLTKHDNLTDKDTIQVKDEYTYDADTMSYKVEPIATQEATESFDKVIDIKDLKVGASFEGATISKISLEIFGNSMAEFALSLTGEFTLKGTLAYSEFEDSIIFTVDESKYPTEIRLSDDLGTFNPFGWPMGFRNGEVLIQQLGEVTYNKLLSDPGYYVRLTVSAMDYDYYCTIPGQAGGSWELLQILEIKN